ncbi:hypothetical protein ACLQ2Q_13490 [Microbacterium sp. DT81.1]|uniref:hypothetical protein n=1 Tax=Microbacterium sp. DT81.1 TaxID=3393413 RepID=UPI003CEB773E
MRIWKSIVVGIVVNLLVLAVGVTIQFATGQWGLPWLAAPLIAVVAALGEVVREYVVARSGRRRSTAPGPGGAAGPRGGGAPVAIAVLVIVAVVGLTGALVTYGVATLTGFLTGDQEGVPRLQNAPVTVDSGGVVTTVESLDHTKDFTRVELTVQNGLANTISLPLYANATLSAEDGTTLEADPFRSSWSESIAAGQLRRGTIVFLGHLPDGPGTATLGFTTVFVQGFDGPASILVSGLSIAPLDPASASPIAHRPPVLRGTVDAG